MFTTDLHIEELQLSDKLKGLPMLAKYDEAFKTLIEQVFAGSVILAPYERAFELFITQKKEDIKFPFVSIFPQQGYKIIANNFAQTNIGHSINKQAPIYDPDTLRRKGTSDSMQNFYQVINFDITYQLECWSTDRIEALRLVQEFLFWFKSQGQVLVSYRGKTYGCNMKLSDTIMDNSSDGSVFVRRRLSFGLCEDDGDFCVFLLRVQ